MDPENQDRPRLPETPPDPIQGTFPISDEWINAAKKEGRQEHTFLTSLYPAEPTSSAWKAPVPASILWHGSLSRGTVRLSVLSSSFTLEADLAVVRKTILDHLAAQGRIFTDGVTTRLQDWSWDGEKLTLVVQRGSYFDYLGTNWAAAEGLTVEREGRAIPVRELVEPGPALTPLPRARAANHLGVAVMLLCERYALFNVRGQQTTYPGMLDLSASGVLAFEGDKTDPFRHVLTELEEEAGLGADDVDVDSLRLIGLSREHRRAGKPDLFFTVQGRRSLDDLKSIVAQRRGVDSDESAYQLWLPIATLAASPTLLLDFPMSPVVQTGLWLLAQQA